MQMLTGVAWHHLVVAGWRAADSVETREPAELRRGTAVDPVVLVDKLSLQEAKRRSNPLREKAATRQTGDCFAASLLIMTGGGDAMRIIDARIMVADQNVGCVDLRGRRRRDRALLRRRRPMLPGDRTLCPPLGPWRCLVPGAGAATLARCRWRCEIGHRRPVRLQLHVASRYRRGFTQYAGLSPRVLEWLPMGGACGVIALRRAARAIQAGDAEIVACIAGDTANETSFRDLARDFQQFLARCGVSVWRRRAERELRADRRRVHALPPAPRGRISASWPSRNGPTRGATRLPCCAAN